MLLTILLFRTKNSQVILKQLLSLCYLYFLYNLIKWQINSVVSICHCAKEFPHSRSNILITTFLSLLQKSRRETVSKADISKNFFYYIFMRIQVYFYNQTFFQFLVSAQQKNNSRHLYTKCQTNLIYLSLKRVFLKATKICLNLYKTFVWHMGNRERRWERQKFFHRTLPEPRPRARQ